MNGFSPMLCTLAKKPFDDENFLFEKKFDGIRCLAVITDKVHLYSRNKKLLNSSFPEITIALKPFKNLILDGEIVTFSKNISSFKKLQNRLNVKNPSKKLIKKYPAFFYIFDCLKKNSQNLINLSLIDRKKILKKAINYKKPLMWTTFIKKNGKNFYKKAKQKGWEGIVGKKMSSHYLNKRSKNWVKIKCVLNQEFIIIGYTLPQKSRKGFGALLLGYYEKNKLRYVGKVGTGFTKAFLQSFIKKLKQIKTQKPVSEEKDAIWITPKYIAQIKFTEKTDNKKLRHPVFTGLRKDKKPKEIQGF